MEKQARFKLDDIVRMDYSSSTEHKYVVLRVIELHGRDIFNGEVLEVCGYLNIPVGSTLMQMSENYTLVVDNLGDLFNALDKLESSWEHSK